MGFAALLVGSPYALRTLTCIIDRLAVCVDGALWRGKYMRFFQVAIILSLLAVNAPAQDPLKLLPHAYKLQFENDWVKVVRVHYGPPYRGVYQW